MLDVLVVYYKPVPESEAVDENSNDGYDKRSTDADYDTDCNSNSSD